MMRGIVVLLASLIVSSCPALALSQEKPKTAKRRVATDSTAPKVATGATKPTVSREQAAFKEWANMLRETRAAADRLKSKKASQREDWFNKNFNAREDKILKKYKLDSLTLYGILKTGVLHAWLTESPADRVAAQVMFDPKILRDEMYAWAEANRSGSAPVRPGGSAEDYAGRVKDAASRMADAASKAPLTQCPAKRNDKSVCGRKTVGNPGTKCYEHRAAVDPSE
jgi:hypothetical protein